MKEILADPAAFDRLRAATPWRELLTRLPGVDPLTDVRRAYLLLSGTPAEMAVAAEALADDSLPAPARGVRMLLLAQLRQYEQVLALNYKRRGASEQAQEEACHAYAALSVAHGGLGHHREAYADIQIALEHAEALGMTDRANYLAFLAGRHDTQAGRPDPEAMAQLLLAPMPVARRGLGLRSSAESLMALGDYRDALAVLGPPDADDALTTGLRAFLHELLDLPQIRPYDPHDRAYGTVAAGLARYKAAQDDAADLLDVQHEPQRTYGRLVVGAMYARGQRDMEDIMAVLGAQPDAADQAALWASIRWGALRHRRLLETPLRHVRAVEKALTRCRTARDVMALVRLASPERYLLLAHAPTRLSYSPRTDRLAVLYGDHVAYGSQTIQAPGRSGKVLVAHALGLPDDELARVEQGRLVKKLAQHQIPTPANWGRVVSELEACAVAVAEAGEPVEPWRRALFEAVERLTDNVKQMLPTELTQAFA
ncbi:hypothetical protein [Deinococcus carri]|uniref:hypothetical protein n=1 Tax=Deinococcus carri TaxID=1211323 RepID=UPI0031E74A80